MERPRYLCCCAVTFRESVEIGETALSPQEVQQAVHEMGSAYKGNRYHLLQKNCNAFSNDLCIRLTGKPAPAWVRLITWRSPSADWLADNRRAWTRVARRIAESGAWLA